MNTLMRYLYRDASNYKVWNLVVLAGQISEEQKKRIFGCLEDGENFIPRQVGLPEKRFETINEDDGPFFELDTAYAFEDTKEEPTVDITVDEMVEAFLQHKGHWDLSWPEEESQEQYSAGLSEEIRQRIFEEVLTEKKIQLIRGCLSRWYLEAQINFQSQECMKRYFRRLEVVAMSPDEFFRYTIGYGLNELSQSFAGIKLENELEIPQKRMEQLLTSIIFGETAIYGDVMQYSREEFATRSNILMGQKFLK